MELESYLQDTTVKNLTLGALRSWGKSTTWDFEIV